MTVTKRCGCPHCGKDIGTLACPACYNELCIPCRVKQHERLPDYCIRCRRFVTHPETIGKNDPLPEVRP